MSAIQIIKDLIAKARMEEALNQLDNIAPKDLQNDVISLKGRFAELRRDVMRGVLTTAEINVGNAKITASALGLCREIEARSSSNNAVSESRESSRDGIAPPPGGWPVIKVEPFEGTISVPQGADGKTKVLFATASPQNLRPLAVDQESRYVLIESQGKALNIIVCPNTDRDSMISMVTFEKPQIIHFSGHGTTGGLETIDPRTQNSIQLHNDDLVDMFGLFKELGTKCVVLCSCWSYEQAKVISELDIPVVGMLQPVDDEVAIKFSRDLYYSLLSNNPLDLIFKTARLKVKQESREIPSLWLGGKRIA
jgi:hypothetical protein